MEKEMGSVSIGKLPIIILGLVGFMWTALIPLNAQEAATPEEELRGVWITRFEWPSKDPEQCQKKIQRLFDSAAKKRL